MTPIKIAGVPEHFNFPWQLCLKNDAFKNQDIDLQWTSVPEGTGKICQMLRDGTVDMAVVLTEGIVKDIVEGNPSKIVQVYVKSPLNWGIFVGAKSPYQKVADLENRKAAISRLGSGSHLMCFVNAVQHGWKADNLKFEIVHTIEGAVKALTHGTADYFMWEHFMTQVYVDNGIFRRLADCPSPWPCFVIAVRDEILIKESETVRRILKTINHMTKGFKTIPDIDKTLAASFNQKIEAIQEWLSLTEWSQSAFTEKELNDVLKQLLQVNIIEKQMPLGNIVKAL